VQRCFVQTPDHATAATSGQEEAGRSSAVDPLRRVQEQGTQSILELVAERYQQTPDAPVWTFLDAKGREVRRASYRTLVERAFACAVRLKDVGVRPGDRVALVYEPDTDEFMIGFLGCLVAEAIAVPISAPDPRNLDVDLPRFVHVLRDCDCGVALTTRFYAAAALAGRAWQRLSGGSRTVEWPKLTWIRTDGLSPLPPSARMPIPRPTADTLAYLQYTSGSTSNPKGVMISHANVLQNAEIIRRQTQVTAKSVLLGWVPLFHDMGLVGGPINALYTGAHLVFFSPMSFLKNPRLWLEAMSQYRATHTESPNFGYEFLLRRIAGESLEGIDLSSLTHALFGGEAMRPRTFERVAERLHGTGFRAEAMTNIYGAAEATLFLSGGGTGAPPLLTVDTKALETRRRAVPASPHPSATTTLIGSRIPDDASDFRIVEPETRRLVPEGSVGEIWLSSPSVTRGYWGRSEEENAKTFRARIADDPNPLRTYLRTGDLGFMSDGVLYICGRHKEMMILEGRNLYPMDIEAVAMNAHPALRQGCVEKLVVVAEVKKGPAPGAAPAAAIAVALAEQFHLTCEAVILVKADALPKTSSGKIQRLGVREAYLKGEIDFLHVHTPEPQDPTGPAPDEQALLLQEIERGTFSGDAAATERWFRCLVASALQISPEAVDTSMDLSRYGIDSARAVTMGAQLSKYVGDEIPPSVLFEHRSIDALVGYLCGAQRTGTSVLFQLQEGAAGEYPNLFCVHPAGGSALAYLSFVDKLPREVPVYAFGNESGEVPADNLEAMAERYVTELLAVQPAGAHYLLGYSFGGHALHGRYARSSVPG
jgi:acyl-CoA synthetase (AMP-forming)/AMP-acid ligase II/acyl carrier protein